MRAAGISSTREERTVYEVHRHREDGKKGQRRQPVIEAFGGLDRARIAALGYALDGPTSAGDHFTGRVEVHRIHCQGDARLSSTLIDVLDERVAFRVLNELALPRADQLSVPVEQLQREANRLAPLGV